MRGWLVLLVCGAFFYALNVMMPLSAGDDYVYSFVWDGSGNWNMHLPLPDTARRVTSLEDIVVSQYSHYMTWGGRSVAHCLAQFFLWQGKELFNVCNTLVFMLLLLEIYWLINKGRITWKLQPFRMAWVFFAFWAFVASVPAVALWVTGSCNYLWMAVLYLAFALPYVRSHYEPKWRPRRQKLLAALLPLWGVLAGWSNENSAPLIFLAVALLTYRRWRRGCLTTWQVTGLVGLAVGCLLLFAAPGNLIRHEFEVAKLENDFKATFDRRLLGAFQVLMIVSVFQVLPWFFCLTTLRKKFTPQAGSVLCLVKALCLMAAVALLGLLPVQLIPARAGFFASLCLIVATGSLVHYMSATGENALAPALRRLFIGVGSIYMAVSVISTTYGFWLMHRQALANDALLQAAQGTPVTVTLEPYPISKWLFRISMAHISTGEVATDETAWRNVATAHYYDIKAVRLSHTYEPWENNTW